MIYLVYGKAQCPACDEAALLLRSKKLDHRIYKLDTDYDMDGLMDICEALECVPPRSFPFIVKAATVTGEDGEALTLGALKMELNDV